jgi:hypothetical protein
MLRNALSTIWSKSVVRIACLFPTPLLLALLQRTMRPELTAAIPDNQLASGRCPETLLHKPNYRVADHTIGMSHGNGAALFPLSL